MRCRRSHLSLFAAVTAMCLLILTGCGGSSSKTSTATADYTLAAAPTTLSLTAGAAGQTVSVSAIAISGFSAPVTVSAAGLPTGVTVSPASVSLTAATPQTMTFTAAPNAVAGQAAVTLTGTAGTLTHSATLTLAVAAAGPDFGLSLAPPTAALSAGGSTTVAVTANALGGFTSPVSVSLTGLPAGVTANPATLTLTPGTAQNITFSATPGAAQGAATVTFSGTAGALTHSATLALTVGAAAGVDVSTFHYDNTRAGLNAQETSLTTTNVASTTFGKVGFFSADGKVDAQPLYLSGLAINGGTANVLYVASELDSLYAFNADNGATLWHVSLAGAGEAASDASPGCDQISPKMGITSTPVIDRVKGVIYAVAMTTDSSGGFHQRLHALNLTTGAELAGSPVEIQGTFPGSGPNASGGKLTFDPKQYAERAALLLVNGNVYLTWTSHCDSLPYNGWIMAYDESTLQQTAIINLTPAGIEGSVWMSGDGMAADAAGNIYAAVANGDFDTTLDAQGFPSKHDYGNTILKLSASLMPADYFESYNGVGDSNQDLDIGSGGILLMPDLTDAAGTARHLAVVAGKNTHMYIVDRDNMGKINEKTSDNSNAWEDLQPFSNGVFSTGAFFNGTLYYAAIGDHLKAFPFVQAKTTSTPGSTSAASFPYPGATPVISANGTQNAIAWAAETPSGGNGVLHAYDATNLQHELYNSQQAANNRDSFTGNKFIAPVVVNGKVFVGTPTGVVEFGLLH